MVTYFIQQVYRKLQDLLFDVKTNGQGPQKRVKRALKSFHYNSLLSI